MVGMFHPLRNAQPRRPRTTAPMNDDNPKIAEEIQALEHHITEASIRLADELKLAKELRVEMAAQAEENPTAFVREDSILARALHSCRMRVAEMAAEYDDLVQQKFEFEESLA